MEHSDITLNCSDCNSEFVFTAGEQAFYAEKGFTNQPRRCKNCRDSRKAGSSRGGAGMSGGGGFGAGGGQRSDRQMFPAICDECGQETMVPFQPSGNKPVYCSDCFSARRQQSAYPRY
ncbi:zinc-ribbon domain containing protein [soil metagenome]